MRASVRSGLMAWSASVPSRQSRGASVGLLSGSRLSYRNRCGAGPGEVTDKASFQHWIPTSLGSPLKKASTDYVMLGIGPGQSLGVRFMISIAVVANQQKQDQVCWTERPMASTRIPIPELGHTPL